MFHYNGAINDIMGALFDMEKIDWLKSDYGYIVIVVLLPALSANVRAT